MTLITSITIIAVLLILIYTTYLILRYRDGDFTIKSSEIITEGNVSYRGSIIGRYYTIKTIYNSGRINITRKESNA